MNVELNFNPQFTMLDTTSGIYLEAKENGLTATQINAAVFTKNI